MSIIEKIFCPKSDSEEMNLEESANVVCNNPVILYVDFLLYQMVKSDNLTIEFDSTTIPVLKKSEEFDLDKIDFNQTDYKKILNRIKVMTGLKPHPYDEETSGKIPFMVIGGNFTAFIAVAPHDKSVKITIEKS